LKVDCHGTQPKWNGDLPAQSHATQLTTAQQRLADPLGARCSMARAHSDAARRSDSMCGTHMAWPATSQRRPESGSVFTDECTTKRCSRRAWSRGPTHCKEGWWQKRWHTPVNGHSPARRGNASVGEAPEVDLHAQPEVRKAPQY
jgi:hypothetical protein